MKKIKEKEENDMPKRVKKRVKPVEITKEHDFYIVRLKDGKRFYIYHDDVRKIIDILSKIDEKAYPDKFIPAKVMGDSLVKKRPELDSGMFRVTGGYTKFYNMSLKVLDHYRYIDYYRDGSVFKYKAFKKLEKNAKCMP